MLFAVVLGATLCALSFPAFLILNVSRSLWRTQLLSGFGAAIFFAAALCFVARLRPLRGRAELLPALGAAVIVYCGAHTAIQLGAVRYWDWERHRQAIEQVLRLAPAVRPDTVVALVDVPHEADPFYEDMWFDTALRLAYPDVPVTGVYYYELGHGPGLNNPLVLDNGLWRRPDSEPFSPLVDDVPFANTIVIQYRNDGPFRLLHDVPPEIGDAAELAASYRPTDLIVSSVPSPLARRSYLRGAATGTD
jgi:hypothetical protein